MKYRKTELLASESIATAGIKTLDINLADPISRIHVLVKLTNVGQDPTGHPLEALKKIEILDGSDVLVSLTGSEAAALSFYGTKIQPWAMLDYMNVEYCMAVATIDFGREIWDPELALVPSMFKNLQMKIEHNKALGGNVPVAGSIQVWADIFDEKAISPVGFLQSKEHYQFTQVASTTYYTDLPTDFPMRLIMFGAHNTTEGPEYNIDSIRLTEDHDKHVIIDAGVEELNLQDGSLWPPWMDTWYGEHDAGAAAVFYVAPTWERRSGNVGNANVNSVLQIANSAGQALSVIAEVAGGFEAITIGKNPFGQTALPFGRPSVIEDWWEINSVGSARMRLICAAGPDVSETMKVVTQQMRPY